VEDPGGGRMSIEVIACDNNVTVRVVTQLTHKCPYRDEIDEGQADISWTVDGRTFELHSLAAYLATWKDSEVSHEQITDRIAHDLSTVEGVSDVRVATDWTTAGMRVTCQRGAGGDLLRKPVQSEGRAGDD
jgi:NADPH-dependent 7-cyano-7-deazaguanine reductase QueF